MAAQGRKSSTNQPSIKYMRIPLEFASFELANVRKEEDARTRSDFQPEHSEHSAPKSSKNMLSTSEFMSAVGGIWNSLNQPYAIFQSKPNVKENDVYETENVICFSDDAINIEASNCYTEYFRTGSKSRFFTHKVNSNLEHLKAIQRMSVLEPCSRHDSNISSLWRYTWAANSDAHLESERTDGLDSVGVCYDLGRIYGCIFANPFNGLKDLVKFTQIECTKPAETAASENKTPPADITLYGNMDCKSNDLPNLTKCKDCGVENAEPIENMQQPVSPLSTSYLLEPVANVDAYAISRAPCSGLYSDYHIKVLASSYCTVVESLEESSVSEDKDTCGDDGRQFKELVPEDDPPTELSLSMQNKPTNVVAKQRHAIAGAFAGTFVSLCLHPVDTIKTVIQARSVDQNSIGRVFGSIVSERGITGLYRGIASNIASSAPISAVYTFTYESVKGAMLPLLPKEYHSFAHCTAGGCASIATSFIFTPSERIKQQMQVGSHYQNCWTALVGILERGGLASLYAGWGAVLCRNIPHSIIKFYTYESLKQWMLSSQQSNAHPNTLQTLVCGGVAASTAALFTTPFDVVKTRLQTQIPGSLKHYDGVLHALQEIAKREGLKGLYRGLTPRLAMYMSQGAIFFASYEFFKRVFSFELPKLPARIIKDGQNVEDHSTSSRLHGLHS